MATLDTRSSEKDTNNMKTLAVDIWKTLRVSHIPTASATATNAYTYAYKTKKEDIFNGLN